MRNKIIITISSIITASLLSTSVFFFYSIPHAEAQTGTIDVGSCLGQLAGDVLTDMGLGEVMGFLSTAVPSNDAKQQIKTIKLTVQNCLDALKQLAIKVALANMKKRLLDRITDDTINWIKGNGKPQFITNFGDVLKNTADAVGGDVLRQAGMGNLCSERLGLQLQISLKKVPVFSQDVSCTLSGAAANVAAFGDNFKNGSWIGYGQLLEPSNNRWGLELLSAEELQVKGTGLAEGTKLTMGSSLGFSPTSYCETWTLTGVRISTDSPSETEIANIFWSYFDKERDPDDPPSIADYPRVPDTTYPPDFPQNYANLKYICKQENIKISTPSGVLGAVTNKALTSDPDAIISSDDLTPYISAIFDAAVNRLKEEGVKGLARAGAAVFSQSGRGVPPTPTNDRVYVSGNQTAASGANFTGDILTRVREYYNSTKNDADTAKTDAQSALQKNITSLSNMNDLIECQRSVCVLRNCQTNANVTNSSLLGIPTFISCRNATSTLENLGTTQEEITRLNTNISYIINNTLRDLEGQIAQNSNNQSVLTDILASINTISSSVLNFERTLTDTSNNLDTISGKVSGELTICQKAKRDNTSYDCPPW